MKLRAMGWVLAGLALTYAALSGALYTAMRQPPETFGAVMAKTPMAAMIVLPFEPLWMSARSGHLGTGDAAPDETLPRVDGNGAVRFSEEWNQRPLVLIFGSYT